MAVTATTEKVQGRLKLSNGTDPVTGDVITVNASMPRLAPTATDAQIMAIADAVAPCLTKTVYGVERVTTASLTEN